MKTEFEKKIMELGFLYQCITDDFYILSQNSDTTLIINAQLILSEPIKKVIQVGNNGNIIQTKACFKLKCLNEIKEPCFLILAFPKTSTLSAEYIIIPSSELKRRLYLEDRISSDNHEIEIVFWFMPDNCLYDCTNLGIEGEWFYMSKGQNGRMADGSVWDYTEFLNDWARLK